MSRSQTLIVLAAGVVAGAIAVAVFALSRGDDDGRQARVAERGRRVMPFDLERTTHRFEKRPSGGVQTVVADDPGDRTQAQLIRTHLAKEARLFRQGVFTDPVTIHGPDMPGVAELRAGAADISIRYEQVTAGARLRYETDDPALVAAIHRWFDAQTADHGAHASAAHEP